MRQPIDLSTEMLITRHFNGIKLTRPNHSEVSTNDPQAIALSELLEMPYNIFFHDAGNRVLEANDICAVNCGFDSRQGALGRNVRDICQNEAQSAHVIDNNQRAIKNKELIIADEQLNLWNGNFTHTISFKFPWYGNNDSVIGVFGCAVQVNDNDAAGISEKLTLITKQFISSPVVKQPGIAFDGKYFSSRESDVIKYVLRGKTMREIGEILGLSRRTVESYFENIKLKSNVKTKSELFDKMMNHYG